MAYKLLQALGYYKTKKRIKYHLFCNKLIREDKAKKKSVQAKILAMDSSRLSRNDDASDIIVSLTSYGVRVEDTLPYTLYSLLRQTRMPNRIVVWLDNVNWNDNKLPDLLKKLQSLGVEFYYVDDLRSYKKLIPALHKFPNNVIITVDDDMYCNNRLVECLLDAYNGFGQNCVVGTWAFSEGKEKGSYLPYSQWKDSVSDGADHSYSLIGCGGILYPPNVFDGEILKDDLFMELAPTADDLWFWAMEKRQGIPIKVVPNAGYGFNIPVNRIDAWEPNREGSLYYINEIHGKNDIQLKKIIDYYGLE